MTTDRAPAPPEWGLAYILQDWRRERVVRKAYKAFCDESPDAPRLLAVARERLHGYVRVIESLDVPTDPVADAARRADEDFRWGS